MTWIQQFSRRSVGRWWIVGLTFFFVHLAILYVLKDTLRVPLLAATSFSTEFIILVRFLVNDRWVFSHPRPTWIRLWQFHVASAGGTAIWWTVANTLPRFGIHYLIASTAGTACSVFFSMFTNFLWVWRHRKPAITLSSTGEEAQAVNTD
jgi:putative flippase GtrA